MPEPAAVTICDSTRGVNAVEPPIVLERPPRWNLPALWVIAGFDDRRPRLDRFIVTLFRPPIVSNTSPPVACELIVPPRTPLSALALCATGLALAVAATIVSFIAPLWFAIVALPSGALVGVVLIERGLTHFAVPTGHIGLQDVVAQHRGSRIAYEVLDELLSTVDRPVALDVDPDATGVVVLYQRLGFNRIDRPAPKQGIISMSRPASSSSSGVPATVAGIRPRWLWPSHTEIVIGVLAVIAMGVLHQPGTWSRHVVVATATFAVVVAAGTDLRLHRIPNALVAASVFPLLWIATGAHIVVHAVVGSLIMGGPLLASNLATRGHTPGLGDIKLAAVAGGALGMIEPADAPLAALMITLVGGAIFGAVYQHRTRQKGFPLGPAIAGATIALLTIDGLALRNLI